MHSILQNSKYTFYLKYSVFALLVTTKNIIFKLDYKYNKIVDAFRKLQVSAS